MTYNPSIALARKATGPVRVAVVADEPTARADLLPVLGGIELTVVESSRAEVVLWDPGNDHGAVAKRLGRLTHMDLPVVVVLDDASLAMEALGKGARGVLLRDHVASGVVAALQAAALGLTVLDPDLAPTMVGPSDGRAKIEPHDAAKELTDREAQVIELLAEGMSNKLIASRLGISDHTAKFHVTGVMSKLGAASRTEAVVEAVRRGLVNL